MSLTKLGPYQITRQLGQGGMGVVYEAVHETSGQRAAVKVLSMMLESRKHMRLRFDAEIDTLKKLKHANIVQLYGYGEEEGHIFYAMELVNGKSLQDEMRHGRVFTWQEVLRYAIQICNALKHAHDSGVIHRDIKPANLLLTDDDQIKLSDFGIAKLFGSTQVTAHGGIVGTADYMAPEQAEGKPVTNRCDLYSLGSVIYCLLAGRPPFTARTIAQVLHSLRFDAPVSVRRLAPLTPVELEEVIGQLLEKDPAKRIPTALVLANRLKAIEHGLQSASSAATNAGGGDEYRLADPDGMLPDLTEEGNRTHLTPVGENAVRNEALTWDNLQTQDSEVTPSLVARHRGNLGTPTDISTSTRHFTSIAEDERRSRREAEDEPEVLPWWVKIGATGTLLLIVVLGLWMAFRPPSPDALFAHFQRCGEG